MLRILFCPTSSMVKCKSVIFLSGEFSYDHRTFHESRWPHVAKIILNREITYKIGLSNRYFLIPK